MDPLAALVAFVFVVLDVIALFIAMAAMRPFRFRLKTMLVAVTLVALQLGTILLLNDQYYRQLRDVRSVLADHPEIDRIWLGTNDDVEIEVEQVFFSIQGQPGTTFYSHGIDTVSKDEFRRGLERALKERQPVVRPDYVQEYRIL
jgi:hypothetical protein